MLKSKKTVAVTVLILLLISFVSCSSTEEEATETYTNITQSNIATTAKSVVEEDWLYEGYWLYALGGGEDTDIFVFRFLDSKRVDFTCCYSITETQYDTMPDFTEEKCLLSEDNKFGIMIGNDIHFAFDNDKGKLYIRTDKNMYDELLNYSEVTNKILKDCYKTYNNSNKYINITIDDSSATYNLNNVNLDYAEGKENINGNPSTNPAQSVIAYQDGYYYYYDYDCYITKIKKSEIENASSLPALYPEFTTRFFSILSISVMKNYIYFSAHSEEGYGIYAMPTSYVSEVSPTKIAETYSYEFFICNGKIYYLTSKNISSSSEEISLACWDPDKSEEVNVYTLGTSKDEVSIYLDQVTNGFAYVTVEDLDSYENGFKYLRINLSNKNTTQVIPDGFSGHAIPFVYNGELYFVRNEYADYLVVNFDKNTAKHINPGSSLGWSWDLVSIMGDDILIRKKYDSSGTYIVPIKTIQEICDYNRETLQNGVLPQSFDGKDIGVKLTDDNISINGAYRYENTIFYLTGDYKREKLDKINVDGSSWAEIDDLSPYED